MIAQVCCMLELMKKVFARLAGSLKISRVVQFLTYSDIMMLSGWGLINPILAVFYIRASGRRRSGVGWNGSNGVFCG